MSEKTIKAGVIGWPVKHSLSPIIHNYWLEKNPEIRGSYEKIPVPPEKLGDELKRLADEGYAGVNVTIPYKEKVMEWVEADATAKVIGAVNTITFKPEKLVGKNTDTSGFYRSLRQVEFLSDSFKEYAVIIGAGGAARAVVQTLIPYFKKIAIVNRSKERADDLKRDFNNASLVVYDWDKREDILSSADLLVNTTSLGMKGEPLLEFDLKKLSEKTFVYDVVYNPQETDLIQRARKRGNQTLNGLEMLMYQALPGFAEWFNSGREPEITPELRQLLITELEKRC